MKQGELESQVVEVSTYPEYMSLLPYLKCFVSYAYCLYFVCYMILWHVYAFHELKF